ncbi:MAG: LLM class F420-dependent oxidoreductase [Nitrososphaerota archaeon]|nr:LLM class F420-dependent oxidoreductase [Candidatus Calditenuaceae archaeon]MDW8073416.1 LLM class F420-dependent oxidoreductase [Nitrososphaerota archaeon]
MARPLLGIAVPHFGRNLSPDSVYLVARAAEELGYDSIWTTDHVVIDTSNYYPYGRIYESVATLAAIGAVTERIKIGTSIIVIPMRNAVLTAKQLSTIDSLTGGRLIVGLGVGWNLQEFRNLGADFRRRGRNEEEAIKLMRTLWSSERPVFKGNFYRVEDAVFEPLPPQRGGPPIWLGGNSGVALERALRLAEGWHVTGMHPEDFGEMVRGASERAKPGFVFSARLSVELGGKGPKEYVSALGDRRFILGGEVEKVAEQLSEYVKNGASHLVLYLGDAPAEKYVDNMRRLIRDVAPSISGV